MLRLYHWEPTLNSAEPLICLEEKNLAYESRYVDLFALEQHSPELLRMNPQGQVPVLVHDGRVITETTLMLQYIDAAFPENALAPEKPLERYWMHVWARTADDYFAPALSLLGCHMSGFAKKLDAQARARARAGLARLPPERQAVWRMALDDSYTAEQLEAARSSLGIVAKRMEEALTPSGWLAGSRYSLADIAIFPMALALAGLLPELINETSTPRVCEWLKRIRERPVVLKVLGTARSERPETLFVPGPEMSRWG